MSWSSSSAGLFLGGSKMAELIKEFDWDKTPLGPLGSWPSTLKAVVAMMLRSPLPIVTLWGEAGILIYNDAYSVFAGARHPSLLGAEVRKGWPEVADFNDNVVRTVFRKGETLSYQDQELSLDRGQGPQKVWLDLDYSPIVDDGGTTLGVIAIVVETTARVAADRELRDERTRLKQMYEQSPSFMALLEGPGHRFAIVNPAYRSLVGGRDVKGMTVAQALPEAIEQGYGDLLNRVFNSGEPYFAYGAAFDLPQEDGRTERRFVDFVYQPITDADGLVTGIFVNGIDVTDNMAAQEALRLSEEQFRTFAQAMPNHVWTAPANGLLDWFNERVSAYCGVDNESLMGEGWANIVHPDDRADAALNWRDALDSGEPYEAEFRVRRADGNYRWHLVRALPIHDGSGEIVRWIGTNTDIHEQKLAEAETSRDLQRIWQLSPVLKVVMTPAGKIAAVNPAWERTLGWGETESVGRNILRFVDPACRDASADRLRTLSSTNGELRSQTPMVGKDGQAHLIEWTSISDAGSVYAFGRDITTESETSAALAKSEAALLQAQKMEAIGQLTGGIAHDFNNLLQVIGGNLQLLGKDIAGAGKAEQRLCNAMEGVERGGRLASQLLAFGRRQPLAPKVVNLARLVRGMDEMLRRALGEAIEVETIIGGGLWNTFIDPGNIENALLNLAINARDAMEGRGKLTIETGNTYLDHRYARDHAEVTPGQYVMLAVTDTGPGIPPDIIGKIFDPFFTTKPEGQGTGLGLSMVYGFVKQSGGHVKIYSEVGQGASIKLYLPRSMHKEDDPVQRDTGPVVGGEETILVAEDDPAVRQTVVEMLGELGYKVLQAPDAGAALAILESGMQVDLLFTDVVMPGAIKATELARKAAFRLPYLKVLFTSGYTENSIVHGGRLDEGVELLSKPYTRDALAWKLRDLLGKPQPLAPAETASTTPARVKEDATLPTQPLAVLVCEDEVLIRMSTVDMLEELGHRVIEAGTGKEALELLSGHPVDLLITDVGLPDMAGTTLVERARDITSALPVIFATGHSQVEGVAPDERTRVLIKPFGTEELKAVITVLAPIS